MQPEKTEVEKKDMDNSSTSTKKTKKLLGIIIFLLLVICGMQGWIIFKHVFYRSSEPEIFKNTNKFSSFLDRRFKKQTDESRKLFDQFFNEDFFTNKPAPFEEMERMHQYFEDMMGESSRKLFKNHWDDWFAERFLGGSGEIDVTSEEKKQAYVITVNIPKPKENKLNINIEKDAVFIEGNFSQTIEKKDGHGNVIAKYEKQQFVSKKIPIADNADYEHAKTDHKKDKIIITIPKKSP